MGKSLDRDTTVLVRTANAFNELSVQRDMLKNWNKLLEEQMMTLTTKLKGSRARLSLLKWRLWFWSELLFKEHLLLQNQPYLRCEFLNSNPLNGCKMLRIRRTFLGTWSSILIFPYSFERASDPHHHVSLWRCEAMVAYKIKRWCWIRKAKD